MSKYDNYIYLTICEVSLESYKDTNFSTYVEYCKQMSKSLMDGDISKRDRRDIEKVVNILDKVFSLSPEDTGGVIADYFSLPSDRHMIFEKAVRMTKECFPTMSL